MAAVLYSSIDGVRLLLERGADPNATNKAGATALMWAVPDLAKSRLLIASGADVNARSKNAQRTPLLVAASYPDRFPCCNCCSITAPIFTPRTALACMRSAARLFPPTST